MDVFVKRTGTYIFGQQGGFVDVGVFKGIFQPSEPSFEVFVCVLTLRMTIKRKCDWITDEMALLLKCAHLSLFVQVDKKCLKVGPEMIQGMASFFLTRYRHHMSIMVVLRDIFDHSGHSLPGIFNWKWLVCL